MIVFLIVDFTMQVSGSLGMEKRMKMRGKPVNMGTFQPASDPAAKRRRIRVI